MADMIAAMLMKSYQNDLRKQLKVVQIERRSTVERNRAFEADRLQYQQSKEKKKEMLDEIKEFNNSPRQSIRKISTKRLNVQPSMFETPALANKAALGISVRQLSTPALTPSLKSRNESQRSGVKESASLQSNYLEK